MSLRPIRTLDELEARFTGRGRRRCYGFFHAALPAEPLVFVHVALLPRIADSIAYIDAHAGASAPPAAPSADDGGDDDDALDDVDADDAAADERRALRGAHGACFYSINATQVQGGRGGLCS